MKKYKLDDPHERGQVLYIGLFSELEKLISDGWIEEVKPRSWWQIVYGQTLLVDRRFENYEDANRYFDESNKPIDSELIHVQEID